jgi:DNA-binding transcriptional MerR regulator
VAKGPEAFRTISEASEEIGVAQHVLRFWETRFPFIKPMKRAGGRRFYRPRDIDAMKTLRRLLHDEGMSIAQVQLLYRAKRRPAAAVVSEAPQPPTSAHAQPARGLAIALAELQHAKARLDNLLARC